LLSWPFRPVSVWLGPVYPTYLGREVLVSIKLPLQLHLLLVQSSHLIVHVLSARATAAAAGQNS
jgi:hypothetical protein